MEVLSEVYVVDAVMLLILLCLAIEDYRHMSVSVARIIIMMIIAMGYRFSRCDEDVYSVVTGFIISAGLVVYCLLRKNIGMADVAVVIFMALMKGMTFAMYASLCAAILLSVKVLIHTRNRHGCYNMTVPFIPYLSVGALGVMLCA